MQKPISAANPAPMRFVIVTMDTHVASATDRARQRLERDLPGLRLSVHAASEWSTHPEALKRCVEDIAQGDIILASMLFLEDHFLPVLPALEARRDQCDAMVCMMSAKEVTKLTRVGRFDMSAKPGAAMSFLKKLRGNKDKPGSASAGAGQMKMLRRLPQILRFIPGAAQDMRAYFLSLQYWLSGSEDNMASMVQYLVDRYASGARAALRGKVKVAAPVEYPDVGVYHPRMRGRLSIVAEELPAAAVPRGKVGLLLMRSYILAGNTGHYDGVIAALEARGLAVVPAFASGLDSRPAIDAYFMAQGKPAVDAVISLTGFSLVGGPAYNDAKAAEETLSKLDVPYLSVTPVEFQTLEEWEASDRGMLPVEATMMVAIPELDGATGSMVFGGRSDSLKAANTNDMQSHAERADMLAARVAKLVALRRSARAERKIGVVLFNFPPNAGNTGTAAYLGVFESLFNTLNALRADGYTVDVPASVDALREAVITGNAARFGAMANVHARVPVGDHVRKQKWLAEIEAQWGAAPGKQQSDGGSIFILGAQFGNVLVGVQPAFGYEGDPMRLLFERGFAPTHAFAAFYTYQ